jgi:hypothetical protein
MGQLYVQTSELTNYVAAAWLSTTTAAQQLQACTDASERADSYLRGRYQLPLTQFGTDLKTMTAYIAVYLLGQMRGFNPAAGADQNIVARYYEAVGHPQIPGSGWFPAVQRQAIHPDVTGSASAAPNYQLPQVATSVPRGW